MPEAYPKSKQTGRAAKTEKKSGEKASTFLKRAKGGAGAPVAKAAPEPKAPKAPKPPKAEKPAKPAPPPILTLAQLRSSLVDKIGTSQTALRSHSVTPISATYAAGSRFKWKAFLLGTLAPYFGVRVRPGDYEPSNLNVVMIGGDEHINQFQIVYDATVTELRRTALDAGKTGRPDGEDPLKWQSSYCQAFGDSLEKALADIAVNQKALDAGKALVDELYPPPAPKPEKAPKEAKPKAEKKAPAAKATAKAAA